MKMWNDGRVMKWVGFPDGLGYDQGAVETWYAQVEANPDRHHFVVFVQGIGFCGEVYYAVDKTHQLAGLDIKLVTEAQGRGIAADALSTLITHVFDTEDEVESVWTEPSQENHAARRLYARCGLRPKTRPSEMKLRESFWALTRVEWRSR
jgi:RimJ/RimL family protein N-acetyltransferase